MLPVASSQVYVSLKSALLAVDLRLTCGADFVNCVHVSHRDFKYLDRYVDLVVCWLGNVCCYMRRFMSVRTHVG